MDARINNLLTRRHTGSIQGLDLMGTHTKRNRERESTAELREKREMERQRGRERENKIVQLHSKHYFSFFNKRFHGVVDVWQVQLSTANVSITFLQSAAGL